MDIDVTRFLRKAVTAEGPNTYTLGKAIQEYRQRLGQGTFEVRVDEAGQRLFVRMVAPKGYLLATFTATEMLFQADWKNHWAKPLAAQWVGHEWLVARFLLGWQLDEMQRQGDSMPRWALDIVELVRCVNVCYADYDAIVSSLPKWIALDYEEHDRAVHEAAVAWAGGDPDFR